jgi:hypothetical protein
MKEHEEEPLPIKPGFLERRLRPLFNAVFYNTEHLGEFDYTQHPKWEAYKDALLESNDLLEGILIYKDPIMTPSWDVIYHFKGRSQRPTPPSSATYQKYFRIT